ncbi:MAG: Gfo/Idh/MocA family oxidoreductase [Pseudomonadota bacterium]
MRWAILGTGGVSRRFVLGLRALPGHQALVAASRTPENARRFAQSLGCEAAESYEVAIGRAEVDAVYIATPPASHEALALTAIAAGKPCLVEKPIAANAAAAARIATAARGAGVFCMEALWTRFLPLMDRIRTLLAEERLGTLHSFDGAFHGAALPEGRSSLFDPGRGGGALLHRGVYPLSLARHLLGPVVELTAGGRMGATGVDEEAALLLRHASGALSTMRASIRTDGESAFVLNGTGGSLLVDAPIWRPFSARLVACHPVADSMAGGGKLEALRESGLVHGLKQRAGPALSLFRQLRGKGPQRITARFEGNGYQYQAAALAAAVREGQGESSIMPLDESIEIMALVDRARAVIANHEPSHGSGA